MAKIYFASETKFRILGEYRNTPTPKPTTTMTNHPKLTKGDRIQEIKYGGRYEVMGVIDSLMIRTYEKPNDLIHIGNVIKINK